MIEAIFAFHATVHGTLNQAACIAIAVILRGMHYVSSKNQSC
uniref:Transposase n=1 Tax=Ascaris lumbricoides TaxID=6252 RepID=A0A0M3HGU1_ASCLU